MSIVGIYDRDASHGMTIQIPAWEKNTDFSKFEINKWRDFPVLTKNHKVFRLLKKNYVLILMKKGGSSKRWKNSNEYYSPTLHKMEMHGNYTALAGEAEYSVPYEDLEYYYNSPKTRSYNDDDGIYIYDRNYTEANTYPPRNITNDL